MTENFFEKENNLENTNDLLFSEKSEDGTETFFHKVDDSPYKKILPDRTVRFFEGGEVVHEVRAQKKSFEDTLTPEELHEEEEDRQATKAELERREAMKVRLAEGKKERPTIKSEPVVAVAPREKPKEEESSVETMMDGITFADLERAIPEKTEAGKSEEEITKGGFENLFGIKEEQLNSIEDFGKLSEGQKRLVLQNMEGMTLERVKTEAVKQYKTETAEKSFIPRIARGILKNFYIAKAEKQIAGNLKNEKAANIELLRDLTRMTRESGVGAHFEENGNLVMDYAACDIENPTQEQEEVFKHFNEVAARLVVGNKKEAGKGLKLDVQNNLLEEEYKDALRKVTEIKADQLEYVAIDQRVRMAQFLNANPEVEKELGKISSKPFWHRALFNTATERGGYMAMGYAGRGIAALGGLSVIGAPIIAAGSGAFFARKRAIKTLNEEFEVAKTGEKSGIMTRMEERGGLMQAKTFVEANALSQKIDFLLQKIDGTANETEKARLMTILDKRLYYTHYVIDNELVGFSGEDKKLSEQYDLISKLGQAEVEVQMGEKGIINDLDSRLDKVLALKAERGEKGRKSYIRKQMLMGAALGATFAVIGAEVRGLFFGGKSSETARQVLEAQRGGRVSAGATSAYLGGKGLENNQPFGEVPHKGEIADVTAVHQGGKGFSDIPEKMKGSFAPPLEKNQGNVIDTTLVAKQTAGEGAQEVTGVVPPAPKGAGIQETIPDGSKGGTQGYEATIEKGSNIWNTAEKIAKDHGLSKEGFAKAWGNKESVFTTVDGKKVLISEMGLVQEGDRVVYIPGAGGKGGHFELVDMNNDAKTNAQYYELVQKRKGTPPEWLRKAVLGDKKLTNEDWDKVIESVEKLQAKGFEPIKTDQPLSELKGGRIEEIVSPQRSVSAGQELPNKGTTRTPMEELTSIERELPKKELPKGLMFEYDLNGNPREMHLSATLVGTTGEEYLVGDYHKDIIELALKNNKDVQFSIDQVRGTGRSILAETMTYEQLKNDPTHQKEARFLLESMKKELKHLKEEYGERIIDREKLPAYLKEINTHHQIDVISQTEIPRASVENIPDKILHGVQFEYDTNGNPTIVRTKGSFGNSFVQHLIHDPGDKLIKTVFVRRNSLLNDDYFTGDYRKKALDFALKNLKNKDYSQPAFDAINDVRGEMWGLSEQIRIYEKLKDIHSYEKEARFLLEGMKENLKSIEKNYGDGVVDHTKLPEYLK